MRFSHRKKIILLFLLVAAVFWFGGANKLAVADAADTLKKISGGPVSWVGGLMALGDITAKFITYVAQGIGYVGGFIGGVFITIAMYLMLLAMNINKTLLSSQIVQNGWDFTLSIANLGFVLAIIIIAFATILHLETYGMKKTLVKLIVAALLVNFSLVIAGAFMSVSDIFSDAVLENGGFNGGLEGIIKQPLQWSNAFGTMLGHQRLLKSGGIQTTKCVQWEDSEASEKCKDGYSVCVASGGDLEGCNKVLEECLNKDGKCVKEEVVTTVDQQWAERLKDGVNNFNTAALKLVASAFFIALFTILATITLLAIAVMLLIRYVYLGILLILSPLVWILWIFPATVGQWQKWWKKFLQWTFFPPIMFFFIVLAKRAMELKSFAGATNNPDAQAAVGTPLTFGIEVIGDMVIVIGLLMGGLIAASALSITGSGLALKMAQKAGKGFGAWSGRMLLRGGTGALRMTGGPEGKTLAQRMQERTAGMGWLGRQTLGRLARRTAQLSDVGIRGQMEQYQKQFAKMSGSELAGVATTTLNSLKRTMAELALAGKKVFNEDKLLADENVKKRFTKYGKGKEYEDMELAMGGTWETHAAAKEVAAAEASGDTNRWVAAQEKLENLKKEFIGKAGKEGIAKIDFAKNLGSKPAFGRSPEIHAAEGEALINALMSERPEAIGMAAGRLSGNAIPEFSRIMRLSFKQAFGKIKNKAVANGNLDASELKRLHALSVTEGKELEALKDLKEVLKVKEPGLHFQAERIGRGLRSLAHSVFEPFGGVAGGRPPRTKEEEEEE